MSKPAVCSDKFEERGVYMQDKSKTFKDAKERYEMCCRICILHGRDERKDCTVCPIRATFLADCGGGMYRMKAEDIVYVNLERASTGE